MRFTAPCPTLRRHGTDPVFVTIRLSRGRRPGAYVEASVAASTRTADARQATGVTVTEADGLADTVALTDVVGFAEAVVDVEGCAVELDVADVVGPAAAATGVGLPSGPSAHQPTATTRATSTNATPRLSQYAPGGSGPTGCRMLPTGRSLGLRARIGRMSAEPTRAVHRQVLSWYASHARTLPWRGADVGGWAVLVSEVMLQQTPVARVLPVYEQWLQRWPEPADLARDAPGEAVRMWGRLGYPRRALRLHAAAQVCVDQHDGQVPHDLASLRALPGVGEYTAAAVASFAYGGRHAVLDTNVRRVHARLFGGQEFEPAGATTAAERRRAVDLLPDDATTAATWAVAVMELGALICTARAPRCEQCPVRSACAWLQAGQPGWSGPPRTGQTYAGTDRQVRGLLLSVLRGQPGPATQAALDQTWPEAVQRARALDGLVADGLVEPLADGTFALPSAR